MFYRLLLIVDLSEKQYSVCAICYALFKIVPDEVNVSELASMYQ